MAVRPQGPRLHFTPLVLERGGHGAAQARSYCSDADHSHSRRPCIAHEIACRQAIRFRVEGVIGVTFGDRDAHRIRHSGGNTGALTKRCRNGCPAQVADGGEIFVELRTHAVGRAGLELSQLDEIARAARRDDLLPVAVDEHQATRSRLPGSSKRCAIDSRSRASVAKGSIHLQPNSSAPPQPAGTVPPSAGTYRGSGRSYAPPESARGPRGCTPPD